jgi:hypothetical protein
VELKELGEFLDYEQPGNFIVRSTEYSDDLATPVLTAGKALFLVIQMRLMEYIKRVGISCDYF